SITSPRLLLLMLRTINRTCSFGNKLVKNTKSDFILPTKTDFIKLSTNLLLRFLLNTTFVTDLYKKSRGALELPDFKLICKFILLLLFCCLKSYKLQKQYLVLIERLNSSQ